MTARVHRCACVSPRFWPVIVVVWDRVSLALNEWDAVVKKRICTVLVT